MTALEPTEVLPPVPRTAHGTLSPQQHAAMSDWTSRRLVLVGGYRSGKTHTLACKALDLARRNWPAKILFGAPTWAMVEAVFVEELGTLCERLGVHMLWRFSKREITLYRKRPCRIVCRSLETPRNAEGLTVAAALLDEWELLKPQAIKTVDARITVGAARQLVLGGTAEGYGPAHQLVLKSPAPGTREIILPTLSNAANLDPDYIEQLRSMLDEEEQLEKLEGIRQSKGGLVYRRLKRELAFGLSSVPRGEVQVWADFNVGAQCWFIVEVDRDSRRAHVAQEVIGYERDTDQHCGTMMQAIAAYLSRTRGRTVTADDVRQSHIPFVCDSSGRNRGAVGSHTQVVAGHGFRPLYSSKGNPDVEDRVLSVNLMLASGALTIDEKACPWLATSITQQGRDLSGAPAKHADPKQDYSGPVDAIGYGVWWWWPALRYRANSVAWDPRPSSQHSGDYLFGDRPAPLR